MSDSKNTKTVITDNRGNLNVGPGQVIHHGTKSTDKKTNK